MLELKSVSKSFGGVAALREVDFSLAKGEIHGLVGENGAGKSTMMKIIAGVHHDFDGEMLLNGKPVRFRSPRDSLSAGIGMVHQELSVVPDLTVAENVFLGSQPVKAGGIVDWSRMAREARTQIASLGLDIDPSTRMGSLPVGIQQLIELSRVLFSGARIIILDEPTSALSPPEVERLFKALRQLRAEGRSLIFISHFLEDVLAISDHVTIFRNGKKVATQNSASTSKDQLISLMIGRGGAELSAGESADLPGATGKPVVLAAQGVSQGGVLKDLSLEARAGEILGVYGFMGCGQIELARCLFGKLPLDSGTVMLDGQPLPLSSTARARKAGIAYVPENRRMMLFRTEPMYKNISISILDQIHRLLLKPQAERTIAKTRIADLQIRPPNAENAGWSAFGRKPAESRARQVADAQAESSYPFRADARHGCRRETGRDPYPEGVARPGRRRHRALDRARNHLDARRPGGGDEARAGGESLRSGPRRQKRSVGGSLNLYRLICWGV